MISKNISRFSLFMDEFTSYVFKMLLFHDFSDMIYSLFRIQRIILFKESRTTRAELFLKKKNKHSKVECIIHLMDITLKNYNKKPTPDLH